MGKLINVTILVVLFFLFIFNLKVEAYQSVRPSLRRNGTYVMPHYRTSPNSYKWDNWSSKGNVNPFTGRKGYKSPF